MKFIGLGTGASPANAPAAPRAPPALGFPQPCRYVQAAVKAATHLVTNAPKVQPTPVERCGPGQESPPGSACRSPAGEPAYQRAAIRRAPACRSEERRVG